MLRDQGYPESAAKMGQVCKPDYERLINDKKGRLGLTTNLRESVFAYIGNTMHMDSKVAEMIGELTAERRFLIAEIDRLIEEQEKNSE